jgi:N-acetylmuramoyl-L-alanine amidase
MMHSLARYSLMLVGVVTLATFAASCSPSRPATASPQQIPQRSPRHGDEIVVAGQYFRTGAPVVLWTDPGGYNAYRIDPSLKDPRTPRLGTREQTLSDAELQQVQASGWTVGLLQQKVDQFVLHYDVAGTSRQCFKILHELRGLSVHFMLDLDGTIYQTCDLQERTFHATKANPRSVGIEIANMGAYTNTVPLKEWYTKGSDGRTMLTIPKRLGDGGIRDKSVVLRPDRDEMVAGKIHNVTYRQYDLTPQQYASLTRLTAALGTAFPRITIDYPKDTGGQLIPTDLTEPQWRAYTGILGHFHVQRNKTDPGPAFQWDRVIKDARKLMSADAIRRNDDMRGKAVEVREKRAALGE